MTKNAIVLWTGGKDSALALYETIRAGFLVKSLVTFAPAKPHFLAHPISFMKLQSKALGIPHHTVTVKKPFKTSYRKAIDFFIENLNIETIVTGDIAEVGGCPNWVRECTKDSDINVLTPLWGLERYKLINKLLSYKFEVIFSLVKKPWFTPDWVGRELDRKAVEDLSLLSKRTGLDICGENGEYHTLTLDGPLFQKSIGIEKYSKKADGQLMYLNIEKAVLKSKK